MQNTNPLQTRIMVIIADWTKVECKPVLKQHIVLSLQQTKVYPPTTIKAALNALIRKGYLRKAVQTSAYVQLRSL